MNKSLLILLSLFLLLMSNACAQKFMSSSFNFNILWTIDKPQNGNHTFLLIGEGPSEWEQRAEVTIGIDGDIQEVVWENYRGEKAIWSKDTYVDGGVYDLPDGCCASTNQISHKLDLMRHRILGSLRYIPETGTIPLPGSSPDSALDPIATYFDRLWNYVRLEEHYPWDEK